MKILIIGGVTKSLLNFRGHLLQAMVAAGHSVAACANGHDFATEQKLHQVGVRYYPIHLKRASINPISDLRAIIELVRLIAKINPDVVLSYTIKPVIYGGLAARLCSVPSIFSLITGLGYTFMNSDSLIHRLSGIIVRTLYKFSLKKSQKVFFQNPDDQALFIKKQLVESHQSVLVNGSGVDLGYFAATPLPKEPVFLMIGRLLADKGIREYVKAAEIIKKQFPQTRFFLAGNLDPNPTSIKKSELLQWEEAGIIEYLGYLDEVRPAIKKCRCYVLPSYREGMPRTVLEAMSMGRPVITTDAPGCRETIRLTFEGQRQKENGEEVMIGENGFLVRLRDVEALVQAMKKFLEAPDLAGKMAKRSREIAEEKFDVNKVNSVIMKEMRLT